MVANADPDIFRLALSSIPWALADMLQGIKPSFLNQNLH